MPRGQIKIPVKPPISGFRSDAPEWLLPDDAIAQGENVIVRYKRLVVRPGFLTLGGNLTDPVMGGYYWQADPTSYAVVAATTKKRFSFNAGTSTWTDITGSAWTGSSANHARFVTFPYGETQYLIGVNGKDSTIVWDGDSAADSDLGGGAPIAVDVTTCGNRVVYGHVTIGGVTFPNAVMYSSFNDHTVTPAENIINIGETDGFIVACRSLGVQSFAVYLQKGQYIGVQQSSFAPFAIDKRGYQIGPVSAAAVVPVGEVHYYLGGDANVYRFDGSRCIPVGNPVQPAIFADMDPYYRELAHGVFVRRFREVWFWWVPRGSTEVCSGICYNVDEDRWSTIHRYNHSITSAWQWDERDSLPWSALTGTWGTLGLTYPTWISMATQLNLSELLGDGDGNVHVMGRSGQDNGVPIQATWRTPLRPAASFGKDVRADAVEQYIPTRSPGMQVKFRLVQCESPGLPLTYEPTDGWTEIDVEGDEYDERLIEYEQELSPWVALEFLVESANIGAEWDGALVYLYGMGVAA